MKIKNLVLTLIIIFSCSKNEVADVSKADVTFIKAADLSFLPEIEANNILFYNNLVVENP